MKERELNIRVICRWDAEPKVWWAESEDLPGLVTEAPTISELIQRIMDVAPELTPNVIPENFLFVAP